MVALLVFTSTIVNEEGRYEAELVVWLRGLFLPNWRSEDVTGNANYPAPPFPNLHCVRVECPPDIADRIEADARFLITETTVLS